VMMLCIAPILAAGLGRLFLGERVRRATVVAMALAVLGVTVMVYAGLEHDGLLGTLLALAAAFCFAAFTVVLRDAQRRQAGADTLPAVCFAGLFATLIAVVMVLAEGRPILLSANDTLLGLAMGSVQIALGMLLFTWGARHVSAAEATLLSLSEVVLAPVWVWLVFGEVPRSETFVGGAILLGAMVLQAVSGVRRRRPPVGLV